MEDHRMSTKDFAKIADNDTIATTQKALESHGFKVFVVETLADAKQKALELIPEGSEVFTATSDTLDKAGLREIFNDSGKYKSVRHEISDAVERNASEIEKRRIGSAAEYSIGSVNALTADGQAILATASGSQIPGYVYGSDNVVWIVGAQKIVANLDEAMERIEEYVLPMEDVRAQAAYGTGSFVSKLLIYRREGRGRVTIVIAKEAAGY